MAAGTQNGNVTRQSFHDLHVWQKSRELTLAIYRLTRRFPVEEAFGLTSQVRRAAVSISSNIAEGHGRLNSREFRHFLLIARGSNNELSAQLEISADLEYGDPESIREAQKLSNDVENMLFAFLGKLRTKSG